MDDFLYSDDAVVIEPYTGPIIVVAGVNDVVRDLRRNIGALQGGDFNPILSRRLLLQYLDVCGSLQFSSSYGFLEEVMFTLSRHCLSIPRGRSLSDDDQSWPDEVSVRLASLGAVNSFTIPCEYVEHVPDHLWYVYSYGSQLQVIDYFSRSSVVSAPLNRRGSLSDGYERCRCGRWYRHLTVL